jgi:hypothetical protein
MPVLMPNKYPKTGPNYAQHGEVAGYVYYPWTDQYYVDPKAVKKYNEDLGLSEKPKSTTQQLGPIVTVAGATALGSGLIKDPGATIDAITGLPGKLVGGVESTVNKISEGGQKLYDFATGKSATPTTTATPTEAVSTPSGSASGPVTVMGQGAAPTSIVAGAEVPAGYTAVANNADGSVAVVPNGSILRQGISAGQIAQGGLGALQAYQGLTQLGKGNLISGGLNTVGGLGNLATAAGYSGAGSQTLGSILPGVNLALGGYNAIQTANMLGSAPSGGSRNSAGAIGGAGSGAAIGTYFAPGIGTAIGAGIGAALGLAGSVFGSSKGERQQYRDQVRGLLQQNKILDDKFKGTLADGTSYNFGGDGSKIKVDYKDATTGKVIGLVNAITAAEGHTGKGGEATAELYASGALSNAGGDYNKAKANALHFAQQRGMNRDNVIAQINKMAEAGQITADQQAAYVNGANELFNPIQPERKKRR